MCFLFLVFFHTLKPTPRTVSISTDLVQTSVIFLMNYWLKKTLFYLEYMALDLKCYSFKTIYIKTMYVFSTLDWAWESGFSSGEYCGALVWWILFNQLRGGPLPPAPQTAAACRLPFHHSTTMNPTFNGRNCISIGHSYGLSCTGSTTHFALRKHEKSYKIGINAN